MDPRTILCSKCQINQFDDASLGMNLWPDVVDCLVESKPNFAAVDLGVHVEKILSLVPPEFQPALKSAFGKNNASSIPFRLGTLCSGSDAVVDVLNVL